MSGENNPARYFLVGAAIPLAVGLTGSIVRPPPHIAEAVCPGTLGGERENVRVACQGGCRYESFPVINMEPPATRRFCCVHSSIRLLQQRFDVSSMFRV